MVRRLLWLNGLAVVGVALHHASGYGFRAMFFWTDRYMDVSVPNYELAGSLAFYANVFIQQVDSFALPAFMFVSGVFVAFMAGSSGESQNWVAVGSRIKNLFIPFLLWTALFFILLQRRLPSSFEDIVTRYYYIVLLAQCYAISPLLVTLARRNWQVLLLVSASVELVISSLPYFQTLGIPIPGLETLIGITPKWLLPNLLFWYVAGIVAGIHREDLRSRLVLRRNKLAFALLALIPLMMVEYLLVESWVDAPWLGPYFGGVLRTFYGGVLILFFLAVDQERIPFHRGLGLLGTRSLGIYLAHSPVMYLVAVAMYRATPNVLAHQWLYQGILIVFGLGIPILIMEAIKRTPSRRYYRYLFG